jgi:hypothetical protein
VLGMSIEAAMVVGKMCTSVYLLAAVGWVAVCSYAWAWVCVDGAYVWCWCALTRMRCALECGADVHILMCLALEYGA